MEKQFSSIIKRLDIMGGGGGGGRMAVLETRQKVLEEEVRSSTFSSTSVSPSVSGSSTIKQKRVTPAALQVSSGDACTPSSYILFVWLNYFNCRGHFVLHVHNSFDEQRRFKESEQ